MPFLSIAQIGAQLRNREISVSDCVNRYLNRIDTYDKIIGSYYEVGIQSALEDAVRLQALLDQGIDLGPLHGIPIGLKDLINAEGYATTANSRLLKNSRPTDDAVLTSRLRAAGAIILGKNATWEFATGPTSYDCLYPPTRNPWDTDRDTGGTSSGSAAAVAADLCVASIGSDTGGSIRFPAALCGVVGFKPTKNTVSSTGTLTLSQTLDHFGPVARSVADCRALFSVLSDSVVPTITKEKKLRIGVVRTFLKDVEPEPSVLARFDEACFHLEESGATVTELELPGIFDFMDSFIPIALAESYTVHKESLLTDNSAYGEKTRERLNIGQCIGATDYIYALRKRQDLIKEVDKSLQGLDVIIMPTVRATAPLLGELDGLLGIENPLYTRAFNLTGHPAISLPCGKDDQGLPVGLQVIGRRGEDYALLDVAEAVESVLGWGEVPNIRLAD